jgi:HSP20 family molecular chaperone IbpA
LFLHYFAFSFTKNRNLFISSSAIYFKLTERIAMKESNDPLKYRTQTFALLFLVAAVLASSSPIQVAGDRSHSLVFPRAYKYHRRPMDLLSDMLSMPMYNSLFRQQEQLTCLEQALTDEGPTYHVQELPNGEIELTVDVPGVAAKDLTVELLEDGTMLRVSGSRRHHYGLVTEFDQMFRVNKDVDTDSVIVRLSSGVLRISASKKDKVVQKLPIVEDKSEQDIIEAQVLSVDEDQNAAVDVRTEEMIGVTMTREDEQ